MLCNATGCVFQCNLFLPCDLQSDLLFLCNTIPVIVLSCLAMRFEFVTAAAGFVCMLLLLFADDDVEVSRSTSYVGLYRHNNFVTLI